MKQSIRTRYAPSYFEIVPTTLKVPPSVAGVTSSIRTYFLVPTMEASPSAFVWLNVWALHWSRKYHLIWLYYWTLQYCAEGWWGRKTRYWMESKLFTKNVSYRIIIIIKIIIINNNKKQYVHNNSVRNSLLSSRILHCARSTPLSISVESILRSIVWQTGKEVNWKRRLYGTRGILKWHAVED